MRFTFLPMDEMDVYTTQTWRYDGQYAIYDGTENAEEALAEMLDRRSPYYAVRDETDTLVGFFCFGTAAQPWSHSTSDLFSENRMLDVGLGMRPDLTGKGLGLAFVRAGLAFAREQFAPVSFRLFVFSFNERAIRVYERAGFEHTGVSERQDADGVKTFLVMRREA